MKRLVYENERGEQIEFSTHSSFYVNISKDVTGLSDVKMTRYRVRGMGQAGETDIGGDIQSRDVGVTGYIAERGIAASECHARLNRILNPEYRGRLIYETDTARRVIDCVIDTAPVFGAAPILERFDLMFNCPNPYWRDEVETREDVAAWFGGFEFPEPEGLEIYESDSTWEIGYREPSLIVNVVNMGDVRAGLRAEFRALGTLTNPSILNVDTQEFIRLINLTMQAGDVLTVTTGYGEKDIKLKRNGVTSSAFKYIDIDSTYLWLAAGDNLLRYDAVSGLENLEVSIYHNNYYLGVA